MSSAHDMGGMHGLGKVQPDSDELVFHHPWEGRVLALQRALLYTRASNLDMFRDSQERLSDHVYRSASYYRRWLLSLIQSAIEKGLISEDEMAQAHSLRPAQAIERSMHLKDTKAAFIRGNFDRAPTKAARFKPGDKVRTISKSTQGHTRLPQYASNKTGIIEALRGCHVYPDSVVAGKGEDPQWLYTVNFEARTLWGETSDPSLIVSIDAFEPYLEAI